MSKQEPDQLLGGNERYSRQIRFGPIGREGQRRLSDATVLIVGVGALGASIAQHMVRAGVGSVRIVDRDYVELSNLQRQVLFDEDDAREALPKAVAAAAKLKRINSEVRVEAYAADVTAASAPGFAEGADLVLDGTDNAPTRLVLSDLCYRLGIPFLYGGATAASGMSGVFIPGETACLRCLIGGEDDGSTETCDTAGVISPTVDFVASLQAAEALKWLTGNHEAVRRTWLTAELWPFRIRELRMPPPGADCPVCGERHVRQTAGETAENNIIPGGSEADAGSAAVVLCGRDTVQVTMAGKPDMLKLRGELSQKGCRVEQNPYLLRTELPDSGIRLVIFPDGRVLVQGTSDLEEAVRLCNAYLPAASALLL
ncbi:thiamine biosynthesis protein ThiF [Paenibacillus sambharensis]|uniref:Thiamine biosynthesis protein ThiF n=1 Tax=Paenibacillus sambharensis TaxID=1803190 RepID=A0A2W1LKW6_9BACL|nr:ThiF family adenylyltransferase [Paenibacillus sambharensis]PZD95124.1 thiamine biosynthesis protein ThiF [Paenibacillus sambharensis]